MRHAVFATLIAGVVFFIAESWLQQSPRRAAVESARFNAAAMALMALYYYVAEVYTRSGIASRFFNRENGKVNSTAAGILVFFIMILLYGRTASWTTPLAYWPFALLIGICLMIAKNVLIRLYRSVIAAGQGYDPMRIQAPKGTVWPPQYATTVDTAPARGSRLKVKS